MKNFFLSKVRLTYYYPTLFLIFLALVTFSGKIELGGMQLALFSVNSFLLAFYLGPILSGQKQRIDDLAKNIRSEAIAFYSVAILSQDLTPAHKKQIKALASSYLKASIRSKKSGEGEKEYEDMLRYCIDFDDKKDKDVVRKIQEALVKNQENRSAFSMQLRNAVFSHEWFVLFVLFTISLAYVVMIDFNGMFILNAVAALLCTGLTLLLIILAKLTTLTHKKAKTIWQPLDRLIESDFKHIEAS
jgi:hypothetical protein